MASNLRTWRRPWGGQPQEPAPLRAELQRYLSASIIGSSPIFDGCGTVTTAGGIERVATTQGLAWRGDGSNNVAYATPAIDGSIDASVDALFTFICVFRKIGASVDANHIAGYGSSSGGTGNTLFRIIGGSSADAIRLQFQTGSGGTLYNTDSSGASINDGQPHCAVITAPFTSGTDVLRYYIDGKEAGTVTRSGVLANVTFNRVSVGASIRGGAAISAGNFEVVAFVALRGVEMPGAWCLEASRLPSVWDSLFGPRRIWVPVSAGGGGTTISVPAGSLALTGFAPTVSATANQTIAVPAGALTLAGFAPTVNVGANQTISVPAGSLTMTGFAPTVNVGVNQNIAVPAGSLSLTGFAPTISTSANQSIAVPVGSLTLTGFAPTVVQTAHQTINVPLGTLVMAGYAPTVSASGSYTISVPLGALVLTGFAPVVNNSGATVTVTVKLGSWIRYKKITAAVSTLYGLDPTLNTGFFSYSGTNNLILTKLASSAANYLARSSAAKSSGLRYFAFVNTSEAANDGTHIGVVQSSCPLSYPGADANGYGCQINRAAGVGLWNAGSFTSLGGSALVGVGDTGMMAVNFTLGYIWYGRNGTWFNSGDPAAGTGPNQTFAPGTTFYAAVSEAYISVRTCYSLSGAPYAPPSGFSYWDA